MMMITQTTSNHENNQNTFDHDQLPIQLLLVFTLLSVIHIIERWEQTPAERHEPLKLLQRQWYGPIYPVPWRFRFRWLKISWSAQLQFDWLDICSSSCLDSLALPRCLGQWLRGATWCAPRILQLELELIWGRDHKIFKKKRFLMV